MSKQPPVHAPRDKYLPNDPLCASNEPHPKIAGVHERITCRECACLLSPSALTRESAHYYDIGGIGTIDVIRAKLTPNQLRGYYLGNILKYASRLNHKNHGADAAKDAAKLADYAIWLNETYTVVEPTGNGD